MSKILIDRKLVEQALEALQNCANGEDDVLLTRDALAALRAALAKPQEPSKFFDLVTYTGTGVNCAALAEPVQEPVEPVEPVAYIHRQGRHWEVSERPLADDEKARGWTEEPLFTAPPQTAEPVQKPVAWRFEARHIDSAWAAAVTLKHPGPEGVYMRNVTPLYAAPPQRKPLTEEEIQAAWDSVDMRHPRGNETRIAFARAIERAHGITP